MPDAGTTLQIILLCGVGTFLIRLFPIWYKFDDTKTETDRLSVSLFSQVIGPTAIASLLIAMSVPLFSNDMLFGHLVVVFVGFAGTFFTQRIFGGVALPSLVGATCYGVVLWVLEGLY